MCQCLLRISTLVSPWLTFLWLVLAAAAEDPRRLDDYLRRLGLEELRLHHKQQQLARESGGQKRGALAQEIADGYAEQLVAVADEPERFAALKTRVEHLLANYPQARTATLDVVLLQADYQHAEALILAWQAQPNVKQPLDEAREILLRIQPRLALQQQALSEAAEKSADALDHIASEQARQAAEKVVAKQRALAGRAEYFAGWAAYYLGVTRGEPAEASDNFTEAKLHFARLLDVSDDRDYAAVAASELGLESVWRARAVIGLGLAEIGLNHLSAAERVFSWLGDPAVAPAIRDQAIYWHFQGLVNVRLWGPAGRLAADEVAHFSTTATAGKTTLCTTAIEAGAAQAEGEDQRLLVHAGVHGLARLRQFDMLDKLIDKHGLEQTLPGDFQLLWLKGRRQYLSAEKEKDADGFRLAAQTLAEALKTSDARRDTTDASQARYYLGWARYRLDEHEAAAQLFRDAAAALRQELPEVAMQAAWMHCTCLVKLTERNSRLAAAAIAALAAFKQDYPASQEAQQVELLLARLRQSHLPPDQSIRELAKIKPDDASYVGAQLEICQLQHQLLTRGKHDGAKAQELSQDILASAQRVLGAGGALPEQRLKAALISVDVLSRGPKVEWSRIEAFLQRIAGDAEKQPLTAPARIEYEYRCLEMAQHHGNSSAAQQAADVIAKHGQSTAYELPALILVARGADQAVQAADSSQRKSKIEQARRVYERLLRIMGESKETLASNKNALAAASKIASYDEELGNWPDAAGRLDRLVEVLPSDRRLLRRAGLASFHAGQHAAALAYWRTLLSGLESGSEDWLEAKYYQLACLEKTDPAAARKVLSQFQVLYPEVRSDAWRQRFSELASRLAQPG